MGQRADYAALSAYVGSVVLSIGALFLGMIAVRAITRACPLSTHCALFRQTRSLTKPLLSMKSLLIRTSINKRRP